MSEVRKDRVGPTPRTCPHCGAQTAAEQRYCVACGERLEPIPATVAASLEALREGRGASATGFSGGLAKHDEAAVAGDTTTGGHRWPGPRAAAVAVMSLFAFGIVLGSASGQATPVGGIVRVLLEGSPPQAKPPLAATEAIGTPTVAPTAPPTAPPEAMPTSQRSTTAPNTETPSKPSIPPEVPAPEVLPAVKHVFLIVLADHGFQEAFGKASKAPYLATTLVAQGELLANYYAVAQGDLANEIALLSGQGPTIETANDCPRFGDITAPKTGLEEQVEGTGCVYPASTQTLPGELAAGGQHWKAYVEGMGLGEGGVPATCRHPASGALDPNQLPLPGDPYESWRNPFPYFHALTDGGECTEDDVAIEQLAPDLQASAAVPALSYIVPDACHDGSETPCEPGQPAGITDAEPFLRTVVPEIMESTAYREGGLIAITFAQAPQAGPASDSSACCGTPPYPNLPQVPAAQTNGPVKPSGGGGRVGLLLLSPFVKAGSVDESGYFNHFSLLLSVEQLFGLKPLGYAANPALSAFDSTVFNATS